MKLGAYTACLHDKSLPETLEILRDLGLDSAEINSGGFLPPGRSTTCARARMRAASTSSCSGASA
jgi:sugar phosphate isomerase/epimerase